MEANVGARPIVLSVFRRRTADPPLQYQQRSITMNSFVRDLTTATWYNVFFAEMIFRSGHHCLNEIQTD